jgi:hypothetical protein
MASRRAAASAVLPPLIPLLLPLLLPPRPPLLLLPPLGTGREDPAWDDLGASYRVSSSMAIISGLYWTKVA